MNSANVAIQNPCPGCGGSAQATMGPTGAAFSTSLGTRTFIQPEYAVRRCQRCGLVHKSAIASADELDEYYRNVDFQRWASSTLYPTEEVAQGILAEIPSGSRILDFGCSTGRLLSRFTRQHSCFGVEVNAPAAAKAAANGITILTADVAMAEDTPGFDAILLMDVFEHLTEPTGLLAALSRKLVPGGQLIIATGDGDAKAIAGDPANFWYFRNIEHVCMITKDYAAYFAGTHGLAVTRWEQVCHYRGTVPARIHQWAAERSFQVFQRGRWPWLYPVMRILPRVNRAKDWKERPTRNLTADHAVVVLQRPSDNSTA